MATVKAKKRAPAKKVARKTAAAKKVPARKTAKAAKPKATGNGMSRFSLHSAGTAGKRLKRAATGPIPARGRRTAASVPLRSMDPETAAYRHLQNALASSGLPEFSDPQGSQAASSFQRLGTETVPLTNTRTVKYRQEVNKVPVYGSLITVELDENNECLAIGSALGSPKGLSPVAKIAPREVLDKVTKQSGTPAADIKGAPRLHYYFDRDKNKWALAYIVENVPNQNRKKARHQAAYHDYIVNAHTGALITALPRTPTAAVAESGTDDAGARRRFIAESNSATRVLRNETLGVSTFAFAFNDPWNNSHMLPGRAISRRGSEEWKRAGVSAHANAEIVAAFVRDVLKRNGIDNAGRGYISTVDCIVTDESTGPGVWLNAYWDPELKQMVYGQRMREDGSTFSIAAVLDIVAHEIFHGITDTTARLEYANQSGALNESYSDIFGVIVANASRTHRKKWEWRLGVGFEEDGLPLRDIKSPSKCGQPKHMKDYLRTRSDYGGVHTNSGIHNYAAYRVMSATSKGKPVFSAQELGALFYLALTQHLTRTSEFSDSRRALLLVAQTLFRNDSTAVRNTKTGAIKRAFSAAGIYDQ
jgi:Zn-dependent metalloprotease